jgi:UDP-glucose 4-epimerase
MSSGANSKPAILVTGGLGFIGSHTVVELIQSGYEAVIIDNLSNSSLNVLDGIEQITGTRPVSYTSNVLDTIELQRILKDRQIGGVIHFAAYKAVGESVNKPLDYYQNNVGGLISLLVAMKNCAIEKLVFSSSCTVYGQPEKLPVTEDSTVVSAESPYGNTKKVGEEMLRDVSKTGWGKIVSLRYFNPVGAHPSSNIGELPLGVPNNLIPFITQTAAGWREQLTVFGNDYNTPDGSCIRDYIHVVDLAKAHVIALDYVEKMQMPYDMFNLGTGIGLSVLEVISSFEKVSGSKLNYTIGNRRSGDIEKVWADCTKANNILGWKAESGLEKMLLDAWNWQKRLESSTNS